MGAARNKNSGNKYELDTMHLYRATKFFDDLATSRLVSRLRDGMKIDLCNMNEDITGRCQYNIQTKTICGQPNYAKELEKIPKTDGIINVFHHRKTEKRGSRFFGVGNYVFLSEMDWIKLVADRERYRVGFEVLNEYFDSLDEEQQVVVHKTLTELGL